MRPALAILTDAFRLLQARKLFWVSMGISALVALLYLSIGFDDEGVTLFFGAFNFEVPFARKGFNDDLVYLGIFRQFIIGAWLTWVAAMLGLIAYAPVFPEFMEEGSAGVTLSKPVTRPLLFLYKFLGGLLFMAVQVTVFVVIVLIAIRWRLGFWSFSILWSVPVVLLVFSYLLAVMVWLGIKTRSVVASVLLTLVFWFGCFLIQGLEAWTYGSVRSGTGLMGQPLDEDDMAQTEGFHAAAKFCYAVTPKTGATITLLDRWIVLEDGKDLANSSLDAMMDGRDSMSGMSRETLEDDIDRHSPLFIIGSSLLFEGVVLLLGMRAFCRRDF